MRTREQLIRRGEALMKGGPYIGPRGGKWADAAHTIPWEEPKPSGPKAAPKEGKKSSVQRAIELAKQLGIPAEQSGPKSVALGGKAAFDRDLGKWNGQRGDAGRRIASAAKSLVWLKKHEEQRASSKEFAGQMDERRKSGLILRGNTYPFREEIKNAGGVWDRIEKVWLMPSRDVMHAIQGKMAAPPSQIHPKEVRTSEKLPSERQLDYAMSLIQKIGSGWIDVSDSPRPTRGDLSKWSSREVGDLISQLRGEF